MNAKDASLKLPEPLGKYLSMTGAVSLLGRALWVTLKVVTFAILFLCNKTIIAYNKRAFHPRDLLKIVVYQLLITFRHDVKKPNIILIRIEPDLGEF